MGPGQKGPKRGDDVDRRHDATTRRGNVEPVVTDRLRLETCHSPFGRYTKKPDADADVQLLDRGRRQMLCPTVLRILLTW
jgi:hypothetical protein